MNAFIVRLQKIIPVVFLYAFSVITVRAQETPKNKTMELYGHVMLDAGYNLNQTDPNWYDVMRPTKIASFKNEYGTNGNTYMSVRQTRFGIKNYLETPMGKLKTQFEFEMFGTGADAGQTTFRLRHAYAELGHFGVGQYWSPFMDIDVFPNSLEYWGPNGMVLYRNVQIRWMPINGDDKLTFALERPGASSDQGIYAGYSQLAGVKGRLPIPDISAEYRKAFGWGYLELAGMGRRIQWEDMNADTFDFSGGVWGWGLNFSTNIKMGSKNVFRGQLVYGQGIANYMNDATADIGIQKNTGNVNAPLKGVALPILGVVVFLDHQWSDKFSTAIGYSMFDIENSDGQAIDAFSRGQYALVNLLYYPAANAMVGVELQYGDRENYNDGWTTSMTKVQCSFKYKFSQQFYGN